MKKILRPDQAQCVTDLRDAIAIGKRRVMLQLATGGGKTVIASSIVESAASKNKRVLFTVPAVALIDQTVEAFWEHGVRDIGVIQANHVMTDWSKPIQVASVQTLQKRTLPKADVVLIDEAHKWFRFYEKWFMDEEWRNVPIIGLSATPWTKGLGCYYEELIVAGTTADLIEAGALSPFRVFAPSSPDLQGVRTVAGDYHEGDLSAAMDKAPLIADVVQTWLQLGEGRPTLCFAVDRAHAKHLQQQFIAAGVPCGYQDAHSTDAERREIKRQFHNGDVKVVCNVGTLTTGVDWDVRCLILARPTKSKILFTQIVGRALRTAPGKDFALLLDHSDTHLRLGYVTDINIEKLDDGKTKTTESETPIALPKKCPQCAYLKPPRVGQCPNCGFKAEVVSNVETQAGELRELNRKPKGAAAKFKDKEATFGQLKHVARMRGYSSGWAAHKYREIFGTWPNHYTHCPEYEPTPELLSWVKSTQIRYAKRRRVETGQPVSEVA